MIEHRSMDERKKLAYKVMEFLNKQSTTAGGIYNTKYGLLDIYWCKFGWQYQYRTLLELPAAIAETERSKP